jgi:hypothetical protein
LQITYPVTSSQTTQPKTELNNPPPPPPHNQEPSQQATSFLAFGTINTITGDSNLSFDNKRKRREYYHQVNHVAAEGPIVQTNWSHVQITFTEADIKLASFPHTDAMVIIVHIDKWNVTKVLVDNISQAEILFLATFEQIGLNKKQLKEAPKPLYCFGGRKIEPLGSISLPVSFGSLVNAHTKYITFNVVGMSYLYNAIFGRGLLNNFEASLHSLYLCLKVLAAWELFQFMAIKKKQET